MIKIPDFSGALHFPVKVVDGTSTRLKDFVRDLPSTNWTIFTGTIMGALTGLVYFASVLLDKEPNLETFGAWLAFVASWIGFGVRQFRHKRDTWEKGRSPTDAKPATAAAQ